ncbi:T9SS-dependent choice-of-anchor J family protein [Chryseobacterium sp. FH1]|uniref:T9SS-dependent choice-of-anchor J family protein n=1 Tax=Chryseobacterium sp. FH1 TaxID=1233951 RepID=UPI00068F0A89|nr:choice-of-anchor J domain-containing protein [Chryseobacterium sp. FH1]
MKKFLLSCSLALGLSANAQNVVFQDGFEDYTNFSITNVGSWTLRDIDLKTTYGITSGGAPVVFANSGVAKSFQVFNASATIPASTAGFTPRTGNKSLACFNADSAPWNDDWLITPRVGIPGSGTSSVSFWAKAANALYGLEKFQVFVSTTGTQVADFTSISPVIVTVADTTWREFTYDLSAYEGQQIYIGIRCTSDDQFALSIDDFRVTSSVAPTTAPSCVLSVLPANGSTGVNPTPATALNSGLFLSWAASSYATSYDVYLDTNANPTTLVGNFIGTGFAPASSLAPNTTYYWKVVPKNAIGEASTCTIYSFTTGATPPPPITYCTNGSIYPSAALVPSTCNGTTAVNSPTDAWAGEYSNVTVVAGRTYKFETIGQPSYFITIANGTTGVASGTGTVTYTATTSGTLRFYSHVNTACGTAMTNHVRRVTCMGTLAVTDVEKSSLSVYPNPFTDVLKISDVKGVKSVSVNDISGREVKSLAPSAELNLSNLKAGLYIVNLKMEDGSVKTFKAIKK